MTHNELFKRAQKEKNDEFYTQYVDIEKEMIHYVEHFKDKTIYCNCDDPQVSNFFHYFYNNFENLGLKKLIVTCYKNQNEHLFSEHKSEKALYLEYTGSKNTDKISDIKKIDIKQLKEDGDFRSKECIEFLKEADIIITNPPFSLFREYVAQLVEYDKKFIILGNLNAVACSDIFNLFKKNKLWFGQSIYSSFIEFKVSKDYQLNTSNSRIDNEGNKFIKVQSIRWYTNLDFNKFHQNLILHKKYYGNESTYPKYDNYDAINVDVTKDIPIDYSGCMGVPITFIDKYNPNQFEIIGLGNNRNTFIPNKYYINPINIKDGLKKNGNTINSKLTIEVQLKPLGIYYTSENSNYLIVPYARILIKKL